MTDVHDGDVERVMTGAAVGGLQARAQVVVAGKDCASFLQGFLTNDVEALSAGSGCYAAWLTPQGRMLTDMHVLRSADMILLDLPAATAAATLARLEQFHFSEDVTFSAMDAALVGVWVHGPAAGAVLGTVLGAAADPSSWADYHHERLTFRGEPVVAARIDQLGVPGYCVFLSPAVEPALRDALGAAGAAPVSADALEAARIEAQYPLFGIDMTEETIPLEAGLETRAISTSKGCYVGQEVIIRVLHRGHGRVAKRLVGLSIEGPVPAAGTVIYASGAPDAQTAKDVGRVTSAAPRAGGGAQALAYLHRDFTAADTGVAVGDARVPARVRAWR